MKTADVFRGIFNRGLDLGREEPFRLVEFGRCAHEVLNRQGRTVEFSGVIHQGRVPSLPHILDDRFHPLDEGSQVGRGALEEGFTFFRAKGG